MKPENGFSFAATSWFRRTDVTGKRRDERTSKIITKIKIVFVLFFANAHLAHLVFANAQANHKKQLVSIVNSEDFPNMRYNKELDCIDAFIVYSMTETVFARIEGDSLKTFAMIYNGLDFHTVVTIDKNGNEKELAKKPSQGTDIRFKNYNPLIALEY